jgi:hypothetical protein
MFLGFLQLSLVSLGRYALLEAVAEAAATFIKETGYRSCVKPANVNGSGSKENRKE